MLSIRTTIGESYLEKLLSVWSTFNNNLCSSPVKAVLVQEQTCNIYPGCSDKTHLLNPILKPCSCCRVLRGALDHKYIQQSTGSTSRMDPTAAQGKKSVFFTANYCKNLTIKMKNGMVIF